ncbi:hypothetical protein ACHAXA_007206 [Cyclostephanos tholiformis]|uniref:Uncharacterized protein n=1 Tax=Cyclostephanos tholiformis TaxID=382380 RepID=A0ABD3SGV6_9STRA
MDRSRASTPSAIVAAVLLLAFATTTTCVDAYAFGPGIVRHSPNNRSTGGRRDRSAATLYLFPTAPSVSAANHRRGRGGGGGLAPSRGGGNSKSSTKTPIVSSAAKFDSDSVLSACDTLPSFRTAHGLLSPEVVMRILDAHECYPYSSPAISNFLELYRSRGPMACLPMLSDPTVLPELTKAMREVF